MSDLIKTDDIHIKALKSLVPPAVLIDQFPVSDEAALVVQQGRYALRDILSGKDDRVAVIVGPCSIHDPIAALDYAQKLKAVVDQYSNQLFLVMRVYFEKPRTTVGWKGLINDPHLDNSFDINEGLKIGRKLLLDLTEMGLPTGCEFLDTISPQYIADLVSWGAIGARTTESQVHRELASGLSMPVGFKNGTDGSLQIAVDAIGSASASHHFLSVTKQGHLAIVETTGNPDCHVILRGSTKGPNYQKPDVEAAQTLLASKNLPAQLMIDCSHGNSNKDFSRQAIVAANVAEQIAAGNKGIAAIMLESHLFEGRQSEPVKYGVSITDACISWGDTVAVLDNLAQAVKQRQQG
ncbi:MAG: 3-deoxy-7-phosphoheptulonate synthase [Pseudomonadales bacterium]|nr:3-deoxy-7-phosphoheptulonate synthase [Pseudomonadales bacterium]